MTNPDLKAETFQLEDFVPYRLSLLSNTISQGIAQTYRQEFDLTVTEWRIIAVLGRFPGLTASEVTQRTAMDKVAVSRAVARLESRDVLLRRAHDDDRRKVPLELTRDGQSLFDDIVPRASAYESALLDTLNGSDRRALAQMLDVLQETAERLNRSDG